MTIERAIEFLEAFKREYPDDEVEAACDMGIAAIRKHGDCREQTDCDD